MLSVAVSLLAGSVIAATPITPLPWFEFRDYPMKAFEKQWEGVTGFELLVAPDGKIADCKVTKSSGYAELDKTSCYLATRRVKFRPAKGPDGQSVWGVYRTQAVWALPERFIDAPPPPDLEVSVNALPAGFSEPPAVKIAYAVDQQGNPSACTPMPSSLPQPEILVELACKALLGRRPPATPVIGPAGQAVPVVKTGAVLFKSDS
jgi:TonB family protein